MENRILIECTCYDKNFISVFSFIKSAMKTESNTLNCNLDCSSLKIIISTDSVANPKNVNISPILSGDKALYYFPLPLNRLSNTTINIIVKIEDDTDMDVFSYRYLFLVANLLRKDDKIFFECPDTYYHKISSYIFAQAHLGLNHNIYSRTGRTIKKFPKTFTVSKEWLPAIYLSKKSPEFYHVLINPIFDAATTLEAAFQEIKGINKYTLPEGDIKKTAYLRKCLRLYSAFWADDQILESSIIERFHNIHGLAQMLFLLIYSKYSKKPSQKRYLYGGDRLEKLLELCCDFSDCILQTAENVISHTDGGVLSIRLNDNWSKIENDYSISPGKKGNLYLRISLADSSDIPIVESVRKKSNISELKLKHIFDDNLVPDETAQKYAAYLSDPKRIIHHYGLMVFRDIANQYGGIFSVASISSEKVEFYCSKPEMPELKNPRIPGSEYDIILPVDEKIFEYDEKINQVSILLNPSHVVSATNKIILFDEKLYDQFNGTLNDLIRKKSETISDYQILKETVVNEHAEHITFEMNKMYGEELNDCVVYFYLSSIADQVFGRSEMVAKILLQIIKNLKEYYDVNNLNFVIYGFSESRLLLFTRQFALFYHRINGNKLMAGCNIYAVSRSYESEVLFSGKSLKSIYNYSVSRQLITGASSNISNILRHIALRERPSAKDENNNYYIFNFDLLHRMEIVDDDPNKKVCLSSHNKWYFHNLQKVLENDIHGGDLGCKLDNVHISAGNVHFHSFYEGELLFGNMYWLRIFANYICDEILADERIDAKAQLLLYGYETYSEPMLFEASEILDKKGYNVSYAIYENPKYITPAEKSSKQVRYIKNWLTESCKHKIEEVCIVYILGISATLSTMQNDMYNALIKSFEMAYNPLEIYKTYQKGMTIIQVNSIEKNDIIEIDASKSTVKRVDHGLDFLFDKSCNYLIEVKSDWHKADNCKYCISAYDYLNEMPIIHTNETSTVPLVLFKSNQRMPLNISYKQEKHYTTYFLNDPKNAEYLYYCHLDRSGNHYQFYIRTAALVDDYIANRDKQFIEWLNDIRDKENLDDTEVQKSVINIIVSPLHFSNEKFIAAVNKQVFNGEAYIINFDVKKEFRDSFIAKFHNYFNTLDIFDKNTTIDNSICVNLYYVDDIILTGNTYNRAKSLISSAFGKYAYLRENSKISLNIFKGIILLVNRNSKETMRNYFSNVDFNKNEADNVVLPVYSFIELDTPAIRSYGDSCPVCNKVERILKLKNESSQSFMVRHWDEKAKYHGLKKLSDAKEDKAEKHKLHENDLYYQLRGFRRLKCSEKIWELIKTHDINLQNAEDLLQGCICSHISGLVDVTEKTEYLISYLKIISREHVIYQENLIPASFKILLNIFAMYIDDVRPSSELYGIVEEIINSSNPKLSYVLYRLIVARLCAMGSTVFCRKEELRKCLEVGLKLSSKLKDVDDSNDSFPEFLCMQIKKMVFCSHDCEIRAKRLREILRDEITDILTKNDISNNKTDKQRIDFYVSMYIESFTDESRNEFLSNEISLKTFCDSIKSDEYSKILNAFKELTKADNIIMFQARNQGLLNDSQKENDIIILSQPSSSKTSELSAMRSELLEFYRNHSSENGRPYSTEVLNVFDSIKIVNVDEHQHDLSVQDYKRKECRIAYVSFEYVDALKDSPEKTEKIYFAFFYSEKDNSKLLDIIDDIGGFLSFRNHLQTRIEKDFNGNLFAERVEERWRTDWLGLEKAGAHTDSMGVTRIIAENKKLMQNSRILDVIFENNNHSDSKSVCQISKLIYNVLIAMYYRSVISEGSERFVTANNIIENGTHINDDDNYSTLSDLINFKDCTIPSKTIHIKCMHSEGCKDINDFKIYSKQSTYLHESKKTSGIPAIKKVSFTKKYLRAFLVDILCNIEAYGKKDTDAIIRVEKRNDKVMDLVFENQVDVESNSQEYCLRNNYRLKQAIEYDYIDNTLPKGISLGCIAHFVNNQDNRLIASYSYHDNKCTFTIKLPILEKETD